ncbi:MAG TPA: transposase [Candidatus Acidoferrum sp.]|nr:transposase [Candidatus Acidoferrum sp.]
MQKILELLRSECAGRGFVVNAYCVMPDHLHFPCEGVEPDVDLLRLVTSFRIKSSRKFALENGGILWQRGYYKPILRAGDAAELVAWYVWLNPVRKGLVSRAQEYQFAGSFTGWKMPASWSEEEWTPPWKGKGRGTAEE